MNNFRWIVAILFSLLMTCPAPLVVGAASTVRTTEPISSLPELTAYPDDNDLITIVDVSDTSISSTGMTKRLKWQYVEQAASTLVHQNDYDPSGNPWAFGVHENTKTLRWADSEGAVYIIGSIDDTAGQSETGRTFSANHLLSTFLKLVGGTLTGYLTLHADPTSDLHAATKKYVDDQIASIPTQDNNNVAITGGTISGVTIAFGSLTANGVKGYTYSVTAGESLDAYDVVALRNDTGTAKAYKYRCASADSDKALLAIGITTASISSGSTGTIITDGLVRNSGWSLTATDTGKTVYASTTDGMISTTTPSSTGDVIQALGRVVDGAAEIIYFRPSMDYGVIQ